MCIVRPQKHASCHIKVVYRKYDSASVVLIRCFQHSFYNPRFIAARSNVCAVSGAPATLCKVALLHNLGSLIVMIY